MILFPWGFIFLACHIRYLFGSREESMIVLRRWATHSQRLMKILLNLDHRVEGLENLPPSPYILAAKHQSAWDTFIYSGIVENPSYVAKRELSRIPLYGHFMKKFDLVTVDRGKGASSLKEMLRHAESICHDQKRPLIIFPEGTRTDPGTHIAYQSGVAALYSHLRIPVVPVAVNSGFFWGRRSFVKKPGRITLKFLPPLMPGLDKREFMSKLELIIETESLKLLERAQQGI